MRTELQVTVRDENKILLEHDETGPGIKRNSRYIGES